MQLAEIVQSLDTKVEIFIAFSTHLSNFTSRISVLVFAMLSACFVNKARLVLRTRTNKKALSVHFQTQPAE